MATASGRPGRPAGDRRPRTPAQTFALVFGAVYLLVGLVGFAVTGFDNFATFTPNEEKLLIFSLNPLHNLVHIAIGAAWVASAARHDSARAANLGIGVVYLLVAALAFLEVDFVLELLNIREGSGDPDNFLHLVSGAASVFFGTAGAEGPADRRPATTA